MRGSPAVVVAGAQGLPPQRPRLLVVTRELLPFSQTFVREQALALTRWQPTLVGLEHVGELDPAPLPSFALAEAAPRGPQALAARLREWLWRPDRRHLRRLQGSGYALIHAHFGTSAVWFWPLAQRLALPLLVTLHGYDIAVRAEWWQAGGGGEIQRRYPARLRSLAAHGMRFLAVSEGVRARAIAYGIAPECVRVHYIGVDTRRFRMRGAPLPARARRILFVGRLVEKKGCEHLLQAFARLATELPEAELTIIGEGPLLASLQQRCRKLAIEPRFLGAQSHERVRAELDAARVLCVPSVEAANGDTEGLPVTILEAAAMGVPVVSSARLAPGEGLIDGVTGFHCAERDAEGLARRLAQLLRDDALATAMSAAAVALVRARFDLAACTRSLEDIYDRMLGEARSAPLRAAAQSI
jgi:glycosyltransferase involved in cell wall biosynthesis